MSRLSVSLLGPPLVEVDGRPIQVDTRKAIALVAYLALTPGPQRRDSLAGLLWPDYDQERSRAALRRTLSALKRALGVGWLEASRETIALARRPGLVVDVEQFDRLLGEAEAHEHREDASCMSCPALLEEAVRLYRADFLAGFTLRDSSNFDDWQFFEGERLRRRLGGALERLVEALASQGHLHSAIEHGRRWLALDSLHEPAHRRLMLLYAWKGDRSAALRQYRECVRTLEAELGVPPLEETTRLYQSIAENQVVSPARTAPPAGAKQVPLGPALPLVGRGVELNALRQAQRRGDVMAIEGEAGIGKTRLAEEFVESLRWEGVIVVRARCYPGERALAYGPVTQALRSMLADEAQVDRLMRVADHWLGEAARLVPELADLPRQLPAPLPLEPAGARARLLEGLRQVILSVAGSSARGVLFFDDLQWIDEASLDFLSYLVRRPKTGLSVLLAWRSEHRLPGHRLLEEARPGGGVTLLSLDRLAPAQVSELVDRAGVASSSDVTALLFEETEGLPFFVVEWLNAMGEGVEPDRSLPGGIRQLLRSRLRECSEAAAQVLTAAAVIGRSFDFDMARMAGGRTEEETVAALEELTARGLVHELGGGEGQLLSFDFSHEHLRRLVYEDASLARRRLLHRRVAEGLLVGARAAGDRPVPAARVALHYRLSGHDGEAARYHRLAGDQARSLYANAEALDHFRSALALGHPDRAGLHEAMGDLQTLSGDYGPAQVSYEMAAASSSPGDLWVIEHKLGSLSQRRGEWEMAERHLEAALEALGDEGRQAERARVLADRSLAAQRLGQAGRARGLAEEALSLALGSGDRAALAQAHNILGILATNRGEEKAAQEHLRRSVAVAELLDEGSARVAALNNLALALGAAGELEPAIELIEGALVICVTQGDRHREAALHNNLADLLRQAGRVEEAMGHLKQAVSIFAEIGGDEGAPRQPEIWKLTEW
ncbi:MAG: AAA family ATPase [Actinomycetota bacterium]|nr:AAA family ATPase [Actinomycetota bacterium]